MFHSAVESNQKFKIANMRRESKTLNIRKDCVSEPTWFGVPTEDRPDIWPVPPTGPPPVLDWLDPGELPVWGMIRSVSIMMAAPINGIETLYSLSLL